MTNDLLLPELTAYTADEWEEVSQKSSAVGLYRSWLEKSTENDPLSEIRLFRHRAWLRSALATYFEREPTEKICQFWSWTADQALARAWSFSGLHELPVALLAMGKLGSQELNLSSDIDLMLISDSGGAAPIEASLKIFRSFLAKNTHFGFCFRLDFDLRPGGRMGPLVSSLRQAEDYYWSLGETWERLALVRTRIVQGPEALCSAINEVFQRFCFRRYIDYGLLDDLKQLRARIHHHYQSSRNSQFNLKLGVGGIRDIELFIHALQVIHGGRDQEFRTRSTSEALRHLLERAILPQEEVEFLYSCYWRFRHLEHMIQLGADTQTHSIDFSNLPHQLRSLEEDEVRKISRRVDQIVTSLLGSASNSEKTLPSTFEKQREWLIALGFSESIVNSLWPKLMAKTALSAKREKDESARKKFLYDFVIEVTNSGVDKELGISLLYEFIQAIRAKASFFGLLSREPRLVRDLARLFSCSPYLGSILASRPELIDSFLFRFRQGFSSDLEVSLDEMAEHRLLTEIVAANQFLVDRDSLLLGQSLSACADYICMELLNRLDEREEGKRLVLVAMGKWGGFELGFRSDLDMIFVSQDLPTEKDHRIARRFVNRLNDVHKGGRIYSVDQVATFRTSWSFDCESGTAGKILNE
ncbi:MAG: glutamine-synthetase adenylyltransferase [Bdellovibrionales bacterium]|nr:glutamine-synthetase adenylyltransferase [Bdellovibrionales bacterium]